MTQVLPDISGMELPLVIGLDKWSLEKAISEPFFWYGELFAKSSAKGFIKPGTKMKRNFPLLLIIDLESLEDIDLMQFDSVRKKVFFSTEWERSCKKAAVMASDIILMKGNTPDIIKKDFVMME